MSFVLKYYVLINVILLQNVLMLPDTTSDTTFCFKYRSTNSFVASNFRFIQTKVNQQFILLQVVICNVRKQLNKYKTFCSIKRQKLQIYSYWYIFGYHTTTIKKGISINKKL